jgi:inner membrane protein
MYGVWRLRGRRTSISDLPPRWGLLFLFAYIAGLSHILLDYTNNYGVRPFWPLSEKWYSWDIVFIVEPALYFILIGGLVLPELVSRRWAPPRGRRSAIVALLCVAAFYAARDYEHREALRALESKLFDGAPPLRASAYPYYWTLFRWYSVAETKNYFVSSDIDSRTGEMNPSEIELTPKPPETAVTLAAKKTYLGQVYLDWAQYPLVSATSAGENWTVRFQDLRFDYPRLRGRITLSGTVELDRELRVIEETFGRRVQKPPLD